MGRAGLVHMGSGFPRVFAKILQKQLLRKDVVIVTGGRGLWIDNEVKDEK